MNRNKLYVDLIGSYTIRSKGKKKYLILKDVLMINPIIRWFEITQYDENRATTTTKLGGTKCLTRHP